MELEKNLRNPTHEIYLDQDEAKSDKAYEKEIQYELEVSDSYHREKCLLVPERARWKEVVNVINDLNKTHDAKKDLLSKVK